MVLNLKEPLPIENRKFDFWSLGIISCFDIRISILASLYRFRDTDLLTCRRAREGLRTLTIINFLFVFRIASIYAQNGQYKSVIAPYFDIWQFRFPWFISLSFTILDSESWPTRISFSVDGESLPRCESREIERILSFSLFKEPTLIESRREWGWTWTFSLLLFSEIMLYY